MSLNPREPDTRHEPAGQPPLAVVSPVTAPPEHLDGFVIEALIGQGGSGAVYLARQLQPERRVALKLLPGALPGSELLFRFERECALLARLEHPNIARLYAVGISQQGGLAQPYMVMEWLSGQPLNLYVRTHQPDLRTRVHLLATLARAAHHVHTLGIVHRDLKPANIMVDDAGVPKIVDFGVACANDHPAETLATLPGHVVGTLRYMPPEQLAATAQARAPQVDIYALGMVGHELLTGALPYTDSAFRTVITAADTLRHSPPELLPARTDLPADLAAVLAKALHSAPEQRYTSMLALALDLERFLAGHPVQARPPSVLHQLRLLVRRHRTFATAGAFSVLAMLAGTAISTRYALNERAHHLDSEARTRQQLDSMRFLQQVLSNAYDTRPGNAQAAMHDVLLHARDHLKQRADLSPEVTIRAKLLIGNTLNNLFDREIGAGLTLEAAAEAERLPGIDPELRAEAQVDKLTAQLTLDQNVAAEQGARALLAVPPGQTAAAHRRWLGVRESLILVLQETDRPQEALALQLEKEAQQARWPDTNPGNRTYDLQRRTSLMVQLGRFDELFALVQGQGNTLVQTLGEDSPGVQNLFNTAAVAARELGHPELALQWTTRFEATMRRTHGPDSVFTRLAEMKTAYQAHLIHPTDPAPVMRLSAIQRTLAQMPRQEPWVLIDARILSDLGHLDGTGPAARLGALQDLRRLDQEVRGGKAENSQQTLRARLVLAQQLARQDRAGAAAVFTPLCADMRRILPAGHPQIRRCERGAAGDRVEQQF